MQLTFGDVEGLGKRKQTCREMFLAEMEQVVPWKSLLKLTKGGYWERLIDRAHRFGKQKVRLMPGQCYAGAWWIAPAAQELLPTAREVWITKGIFDAIALLQHGIAAASGMSSNGYPEESLRALRDQRLSA